MPSKRSTNAAKKKSASSSKKGGGAKVKRSQAQSQTSSLTSTQNDVIGVVVAVMAVAMLVSLVAPSSAVVTSAVASFLTLGFGAGAPLVPIALFLFAMTFFTDEEGPVSGHVAAGLVMIVLAILSMLSLNHAGAEADPSIVLTNEVAATTGGYVGGVVAYALLTLVGTLVGNVVLVGVIVAGIVVCGFSISDAVAKLHARIERISAERRARKDAAIIDAAADYQDVPEKTAVASPQPQPARSLFDDDYVDAGGEKTACIGSRMASVLTRGRGRHAAEPVADEVPTTLIDKNPVQETTVLGGAAAEQATTVLGADAAKTTLLDARDASSAQGGQGGSTEDVPPFLHGRKRSGKAGRAEHVRAKGKVASADSGADLQAGPAENVPAGTSVAVAPAPAKITRPGDADETYQLPPLSILRANKDFDGTYATEGELGAVAAKLQGTLEEFGLSSRVVGWIAGPSVTTFKIAMGEGERVNKIVNLEDDIALSLAAKSVRIFAPIPGTSLVGIEIPNETPQPVYLSDVLPYATGGPLECAFGRDSEGKPIVVDLAELPHLLVAGTTGSGKSVLLNAIIMSMLMRATPEQVRLIMVDPKRVEFTGYAGLPHLYVPVVTEPRQAASALQWGVTEMERRLKVFEHYKVRDIRTYNGNVDGGRYDEMENPPKHMPYFVIVIDELADLMMVAGKDVESSIVRIAQLGRAAGIHLIVATQRPSADVVTGLIRANIDNRVALSVDNAINSRIILDQKGAEQLLGKGDMLVKLRGKKPRRAQGCWVSDEEIEETVQFIREQTTAEYHEDILTAVVPNSPGGGAADVGKDDDPLIWEAAQIVVDSQLGSTSGLQRALSVGYARAGRIMDMLEAKGVVGPANGSKPREVLIDKDGLEDLKVQEAKYREVE